MHAVAEVWIKERQARRAFHVMDGRRLRGMVVSDAGNQPGLPARDVARLVLAIAADGDREAFAALFGHFAPRVKAYLIRLGVQGGAAEELAQETLLTVWRKAATFDPARAGAATWIFTIARNLRIDSLRRDRPKTAIEDPTDTPPQATPEILVTAAERDDQVRTALRTLSPEQAQVIELSFFSDEPHSTIAARLGVPLGTVKSRLRLAMTRLRAQLGDLL